MRVPALVIGCGRIGASWDRPGQKEVLSVAHAMSLDERISEISFFDVNEASARKAAETWGGTFQPDLAAALAAAGGGVVAVCVPDVDHVTLGLRVCESGAELLLMEKPLGQNIEEGECLLKASQDSRTRLSVNHTRRFDPETLRLSKEVREGSWGEVLSASGTYSGGILHNGSHLLDLARLFLGELCSGRILAVADEVIPGDPTLSAELCFDGCRSFRVVGAREELYSIFELDLLLSKGRIRLDRFGMERSLQSVQENPHYPGYRELGPEQRSPTAYLSALSNYVRWNLDAWEKGEPTPSSGEEGFAALTACRRIRQCQEEGGVGASFGD